jgi:transcriptional regulator with XRE-family HTH domain
MESSVEGVQSETARQEIRAATDRIGDRLAAVRGERGITVSEIARLVGVSASAISQIERGTSRPSVATLFALAKALNVPVDAFFDDEELQTRPEPRSATGALLPLPPAPEGERMHPYFVRSGERATLEIKGGVRWERLTPTALEGLDFMELVYAPHAESDPELYRHPGIELVLLLDGRLNIFVGFELYELQPGDSIAFPSSIPHRYVNPTDEESRAVTVILRDALSALPSSGSTMR